MREICPKLVSFFETVFGSEVTKSVRGQMLKLYFETFVAKLAYVIQSETSLEKTDLITRETGYIYAAKHKCNEGQRTFIHKNLLSNWFFPPVPSIRLW